MRWMVRVFFAFSFSLAFAAFGCERSSEADNGSKNEGSTPAPVESNEPIKSLPQVDVSALDSFSQRIWLDMVNELLSPCGDPVSVARCVAENRKCKRCVPAARYVARLVDGGYSRDEIREIYGVRYDENTIVKLSHKGSPLLGSPMAPVTIYEFSDFQCPHCRLAAPYLKGAQHWNSFLSRPLQCLPATGKGATQHLSRVRGDVLDRNLRQVPGESRQVAGADPGVIGGDDDHADFVALLGSGGT